MTVLQLENFPENHYAFKFKYPMIAVSTSVSKLQECVDVLMAYLQLSQCCLRVALGVAALKNQCSRK